MMAAFKRKGSQIYYIGPFRAGPVDVPRLSTGVRDKRTAKAIELALQELAVVGYVDLVRAAARRRVRLLELYTAKIEGDKALSALRESLADKPLADAISEYRLGVEDERVLTGFDQLGALAPEGARLSWLKEPRNLTNLYQRAVAGEDRKGRRRAKNSVRRSLHRAVSELLSHEIGRGQMLAIMAETKLPRADDERMATLTTAEVLDFLDGADDEFRPVIGFAVTTGVDRGPMLQLRVRDWDETTGILSVPDRKTKARPRRLILHGEPVLENAEFWLRQLVSGKRSDERLVPLSEKQIRDRWEYLREEKGRPGLRWKDLRAIFATHYLLAGGDARTLQAVLGHSTMAMTMRYLRQLPIGKRDHLREDAALLSLRGRGAYLRVEEA